MSSMFPMNEALALFGLGVSTVNTLLVAADLGISARDLRNLGRRMKGRTVVGVAEPGFSAIHEIEQRAFRQDRREAFLLFRDRRHASEFKGGTILTEGGSLPITSSPGVEIWTTEEEKGEAARLVADAFSSLYASAKTARGVLRTIRTEVTEGARVWVVGDRKGDEVVAEIVSSFDPTEFLRSRYRSIALILALNFLWFGVGFGLAISRPAFGPLGVVGALLLLLHLIAITPLAVKVRESCRTPAFAFVHGKSGAAA